MTNKIGIQMDNLMVNLPIERAILNSIIFTPILMDEIADKIKSDMFFSQGHKDIFNIIKMRYDKNIPIDEELIISDLKNNKTYKDDIFGEVFTATPITHLDHYVNQLEKLHFKRQSCLIGNKIREIIDKEQDLTIDEYMDKFTKLLDGQLTNAKKSDFKNSNEVMNLTVSMLEQNSQKDGGLVGVDTGYNELNKMTTGFKQGELIIVAARPAMGKTAFALNCVLNLIKQKKGIAFFSLEMSSQQLSVRLLSLITNIPILDLNQGRFTQEQKYLFDNAVDEIRASELFIYDNSNLNISTLRSKLRRLKSTNKGIELAVIDYLQLMSGINSSKDRHLEVSEISRGLKMLARELDIPIIALSQLNRSLEARADKRPMLSDIRESGSIEQDADIILFVYRDDVYLYKEEKEREKQAKKEGKEFKPQYIEKEEEKAEIIIGKQRNGPTGHINLMFQKKFTRFVDTSPKVTQIIYEDGFVEKSIQKEQ